MKMWHVVASLFVLTSGGLHLTGAEVFDGYVIRVVDGDTLIVQVNSSNERVRIFGIDAPELNESGGTEAAQRLKQLANGRMVRLEFVKRDRWRRMVCRVLIGGRRVGPVMIREGFAKWSQRYAPHDTELQQMQP